MNNNRLRLPKSAFATEESISKCTKESPYKDQTASKFEKLVLRVEQLEQEVLRLKQTRILR